MDELHHMGFKAIWMLDPGIKHEKGYSVYESGSEKDIWVQTKDGNPFVGMSISMKYELYLIFNCFQNDSHKFHFPFS